jgi:hypothetical protein
MRCTVIALQMIFELQEQCKMEDDRILVKGLCCILAPFKHVSNLLSDEQYQTFIEALPTLCQLKDFLVEVVDDAKMLSKRSTNASISTFMRKDEHCSSIPVLVHKLKACAKLLLEQFKHCFLQ